MKLRSFLGLHFHSCSLTVQDLTPNVGLFWYFFTEVFEHFRLFFLCVFQINAFIYTLPLSIRFRSEFIASEKAILFKFVNPPSLPSPSPIPPSLSFFLLLFVSLPISSEHPMFLAYVLLSLIALFKSYPCIGDTALPLALLPLWAHTFRCKNLFLSVFCRDQQVINAIRDLFSYSTFTLS